MIRGVCSARTNKPSPPRRGSLTSRLFSKTFHFWCNVANSESPPAYLLFDQSHQVIASLRADQLDVGAIAENVRPLDDRPRAYAVDSVAYVPIFPRCRLIIVGGGHIGMAVGQMASDLEFDVCAIDDRAEFASRDRFPAAQEIIVGPTDYVLPKLEIDSNCYCLIVTRGHKQDEKALYHLIDRGARYIGLIGSHRKINLIFDKVHTKCHPYCGGPD